MWLWFWLQNQLFKVLYPSLRQMSRGSPLGLLCWVFGHLNKFAVTVTVTVICRADGQNYVPHTGPKCSNQFDLTCMFQLVLQTSNSTSSFWLTSRNEAKPEPYINIELWCDPPQSLQDMCKKAQLDWMTDSIQEYWVLTFTLSLFNQSKTQYSWIEPPKKIMQSSWNSTAAN